jgi:hypothetical protein
LKFKNLTAVTEEGQLDDLRDSQWRWRLITAAANGERQRGAHLDVTCCSIRSTKHTWQQGVSSGGSLDRATRGARVLQLE